MRQDLSDILGIDEELKQKCEELLQSNQEELSKISQEIQEIEEKNHELNRKNVHMQNTISDYEVGAYSILFTSFLTDSILFTSLLFILSHNKS